jgi:hypothetical protein
MSRKSIRPQHRRHVWLYDEDVGFIEKFISPRTGLTMSAWVRELVHIRVTQEREFQQLLIEKAQRDHAQASSMPSQGGQNA